MTGQGAHSQGSLIVVGLGIRVAAHCTPEARTAISNSEIVFAVTGDIVAQAWLERLHPNVVSLHGLYAEGKPRRETYDAMVEAIVAAVHAGQHVCAAFYGHPGVYVYPSHAAVARLRSEGYKASMLPAVSSEDCLYADLGVDPGRLGCQSYEATDFIINARQPDTSAGLVLWQIGVIGNLSFPASDLNRNGLNVLTSVLRETYPASHPVTVYEAATLPTTKARITTVTLEDLPLADVTVQSTLYVPPARSPQPDPYRLARLGLGSE